MSYSQFDYRLTADLAAAAAAAAQEQHMIIAKRAEAERHRQTYPRGKRVSFNVLFLVAPVRLEEKK